MVWTRFFVVLLLPVIFLGCTLFFIGMNNTDRGDVRVAGALVGAEKVDATVKRCAIIDDQGNRRLLVELDVVNGGVMTITLKPSEFLAVLAWKDRPLDSNGQAGIFQPLSWTSTCEAALNSQSAIPPDATRSYCLYYWARTLPLGDEWNDYFMTLECYGATGSLLLSAQLNPEGK